MRVPLATYRLQFNRSFRFEDARTLVPYLADLGISDIYASPILRALPGSTHGYDVTSPDELNPELGTWEDFQALTAERQAHGMGWLQDIVPNHMAYSSENGMLMDVFENGPRSRFYAFFDVFRDHPDPELRTQVLAPFLGSPLEEVLQRGEMQLTLDVHGLAVTYFQWRFPLYLPSYESVLRPCRERLSGITASDDPRLRAFAALPDTFACLGEADDSPDKRRQLGEAKKLLAHLYRGHPMVNVCLDDLLESYNRPAQGPVEQSPLYLLLEQQVFKPVFWQVAYEKINYRRFFYLSEFIALRAEDSQVFRATHGRILELTQAGFFTGLRIDHIDGLYNPREYLVRLRQAAPDTYIVVEKILELGEFLRTDWPIQGTSGYKFCNYANGLFCRQENEKALTRTYQEFIGSQPDYTRLLYEEKKKILEGRMAGEVAYLAHLARQVLPGAAALTQESAQAALTALMAAFPVYRTYVDAHHVTEQDREVLTEAVETARSQCPECRPDMDLITDLLLSALQPEADASLRQARRHFLMRFQQFTGPAMAKGFEDTLLYIYNRFVSLNEVGGAPNTFGLSLDRFHGFNQRRARHWPRAMNATSTHDSKRGEDVRARLNVLSEIPELWRQTVMRWADMNERHKQRWDGMPAPHRNDEYLLYQVLVGALPFAEDEYDGFRQRLRDYIVKAVREAKTYSNWLGPDEPYEDACRQFVDAILDRSPGNGFWADFLSFQKEIAEYGIINSLAQTTLKITCPGLPDFYQGTELWDLNLVDPDNRRPVDFGKRARFLEQMQQELDPPPSGSALTDATLAVSQARQLVQSLWETRADGRVKLFLVHRGLQARHESRDLFETGDYVPTSATGSRAEHVIVFFRAWHDDYALTVVPRFVTSLARPGTPPTGREVWEDTRITLPADVPAAWRDAITGNTLHAQDEIHLGDILTSFPVAILLSKPSSSA